MKRFSAAAATALLTLLTAPFAVGEQSARSPELQQLIKAYDAYLSNAYVCRHYVGVMPYQHAEQMAAAHHRRQGASEEQTQRFLDQLRAGYREKAADDQLRERADKGNVPFEVMVQQCEKMIADQRHKAELAEAAYR